MVRQSAASACGEDYLESVKIYGAFTQAALLNGACETNLFIRVDLKNSYPSATAYTLIMDGDNHWGWTSPFQTVTTPKSKGNSFDENIFLSPVFVNSGGGRTLWIEGTHRHTYMGAYTLTTRGSLQPIVLVDEKTGSNEELSMDIHVEGAAISDAFLLSGDNAFPLLAGFAYSDHGTQAINSLLKLDAGIQRATINGGSIRIVESPHGPNVRVFDSPSAWNFSGRIYVPEPGNWPSRPNSFSGEICVAGACRYYGQFFPDTSSAGPPSPAAMNLAAQSQVIGGMPLAEGHCSSRTVSVPGARTGMVVEASPMNYPGDGAFWHAFVSADGEVTVSVCVSLAMTPTSSVYSLRVTP